MIGSNKKAPKWVRLRLVKVESAASEARKLLKCFGNTSTRKGASWSDRGHRITVLSAQALFFFVFVGTTPFAASLTFFSETGVANLLAFNADSSLVHSVFFLARDSLSFFLGGVGGSSHPSGTKSGSSPASIYSSVAFSKSSVLAHIWSHIFLDIQPPTSSSAIFGCFGS